ncbi:hypothetical protein ACVI1K_000279 [Bradyrhizobium sp. USDA 4508]
MALAVLADQRLGLGIGQVLNALPGAEMEFHPDALIVGIDHAVGVAAEAVLVTEAFRDAALAHDDGDLVQRFRQQRPEIPVHVGVAHPRARMPLDGVVEVDEAQGVAEEEHRRVVADHVPIAFIGVEFQRETANVALGVRRAALAGDRREPREHRRLLADLREHAGLGVARDVVGDGEGAVRAGALGMHPPLRDHLAVKMRQLLDQPDILQQCGSARPRRQDVHIIGNGGAGGVGQKRSFGLVAHRKLLAEGQHFAVPAPAGRPGER